MKGIKELSDFGCKHNGNLYNFFAFLTLGIGQNSLILGLDMIQLREPLEINILIFTLDLELDLIVAVKNVLFLLLKVVPSHGLGKV